MKRVQNNYIFDTKLNAQKMVFLSGPRQVGKTTFAEKELKTRNDEALYFNWDDPYVKKEYLANPHFLESYLVKSKSKLPLVVFDEIHKHKNWKNILKGLYDTYKNKAQFLITGSARLEYFTRSGDSLVGRYFSYNMLPLGVAEAAQDFSHILKSESILSRPQENNILKLLNSIEEKKFHPAFTKLLHYGGFPEPFLSLSDAFCFKWRKNYRELLTKEDLRDLTRVHDLKGIEQLILILPEHIGSSLSINALKKDLQVNHKTVAVWIEALKKIYLVFTIAPWAKSINRAIKKEPKLYFYDWQFATSEGSKFENMLAISLLRAVMRFNEMGLGEFELRYVKNTAKEEIDFLIVKNNQPLALFEAKLSETDIPKGAHNLAKTINVPYYQVVAQKDILEARPDNKYIVSAWRLGAILG